MSASILTRPVLIRLLTCDRLHGISPRTFWLTFLLTMLASPFSSSPVLAREQEITIPAQYQIQSDSRSTLIDAAAVPQEDIPGFLPDSQSLPRFYWEYLRAMLTNHAGSQTSSGEIDKIIADFKRKVTPQACELVSPRWHKDLQVLQASLRCNMVEASPTGEQSAKSVEEAVDVLMRKDASGWHLIHELSDNAACALARSKGTYQIWVDYLKRYPDGICHAMAVDRTAPAAEPVKVIRAERNFRFSPDGSRLYSTGSLDGTGLRIIVRDNKGDLLGSQDLDVIEHPDSVAMSSDGRYVLTLNRNALSLYDLKTSKIRTLNPGELPLSGHTRQIAIDSERGHAVLVCLADNGQSTRANRDSVYILSFNLDEGNQSGQSVIMDIAPEAILLSPDGSKLLIMDRNESQKTSFTAVHDTLNGQVLWKESISYDDLERPPNAAWSSQGKLVSFETKNTTEVREASTGKKIALPKRGNRLTNLDLVFADDAMRFLMLEPLYKWITLYDVASDKNIFRYDYGQGDVKDRSGQSAAKAIFSSASENGTFLVQEGDKATLFQINETGVQRVIRDGMP